MIRVTLAVLASLASTGALAGTAVAVPVSEPGVLGLFAAAAVALFVLKKFKK